MLHRFSLNEYNLALDVSSGTLHSLDDISYDLSAYADENMTAEVPAKALSELSDKYSEKDLKEAWAELYKLKEDDIFCSTDSFKKIAKCYSNAPVKSMCLNIAHDCNLRCKYCFASQGDFGGGRKLMSYEVGKAALDFLIRNSGSRHHLEVDFFGGEPLMNWDVVKKLVVYGRELEKKFDKHINFTVTTNGTLLDDEKIAYINKEMHNAVLSIDGRREVNDAMRVRVDGSGSYDEIIKKFKKLVATRNGKEYYVRGTYTHNNLDFCADVFHLADEGFDQISIEPVVCDASTPYALSETDLPTIFNEYDKLALEMLKRKKAGKGFNFFHFMIDLDEGPCIFKLLKGCSCGSEYVAITPEGDIYPCHQFVGQDNMIMGNVLTQEGTFTSPIKDSFSKVNIFSKEGCENCWAKYFCSGGCNANNTLYNNDVNKPLAITCAIQRKRLECALMIKAAEADESED